MSDIKHQADCEQDLLKQRIGDKIAKTFTQADMDKALKEQRDACLKSVMRNSRGWCNHSISVIDSIEKAILSATIKD